MCVTPMRVGLHRGRKVVSTNRDLDNASGHHYCTARSASSLYLNKQVLFTASCGSITNDNDL